MPLFYTDTQNDVLGTRQYFIKFKICDVFFYVL